MIDDIRIELLKLRTTPAAWVTLLAVGALTVLSVITTILLAGHQTAALGTPSNVSHALAVGAATSIAMLVLGITISAGEDRHRTALSTYLAQPRRSRILVAKLLTGGLTGAGLGAAAYAIALAIAVPMYAAKGVHNLPVPLLTLAAGTVLGSTCFGMLGVALGALTRNTVASIVGALAWVGIVELGILHQSLPSISRWLPASAAQALTNAGQDATGSLSYGVAAAVLVGWAAVLSAIASRVTVRREVR